MKNPPLPLSKNALTVLERRYLKRDLAGKPVETAAAMFRRVAETIASAEERLKTGNDSQTLADEFYRLMTSLEFLPNSPTLMNAGRELGQLSACFVLPVGDSLAEIFEAIKQGGTRRGANMGILRIDHPDVMDFIMCKRDQTVLTNFNISVGLTEAFMEAVKHERDWPLVNPRSGEVVRKVSTQVPAPRA